MAARFTLHFSPFLIVLITTFCRNGQAIISKESGESSIQITAMRGDIPWIALLEIPNGEFCSGTIISPTSILSAALCLNGIKNPGHGTAYAGNFKYTEPGDFDLPTQNRSVVEYHLYDENNTEKYNFMLVKIDREWTWSKNVLPALITEYKGLTKHFMAPCQVSGLGYGSSADRDSKIVRSVDMLMAGGRTCPDTPEDFRMCSLDPHNRGACVGDVGGSVVCAYELEERLYGIISEVEHGEVEGHPIHCKLPARISGYQFIGFYMPWIRKLAGDLPSAEEVKALAAAEVNVMAATNVETRSIATDLHALLESGEGADVTLVVGGSQLPAHSSILAARSPVFAAMLRNNMKEALSRRIEITDVQEAVLRQLLCFMYTDTAPQLASVAAEMVAAADKYDLPLLKRKCEERMAQGLSVDNAAAVALLAVRHSCPALESAAVDFVARHPEVMTSVGWINVLRGDPDAAAEICSLVAAATPKVRTPPEEQTQDLAEKLIVAAKNARVDELRRLLAAGASVDAKDSNGYSVLHVAVMNAGSEPARRGRGNTYAQVAAYTGADTVKCLLDAGARVNVKDKSLQTPLHAAAYRGDVKILWALLTAPAKLDVKDRWGKTPLHWAAATENVEAVRTLLLAGANKDVRDYKDLTPADAATSATVALFNMY